jgi:hypothetical protein
LAQQTIPRMNHLGGKRLCREQAAADVREGSSVARHLEVASDRPHRLRRKTGIGDLDFRQHGRLTRGLGNQNARGGIGEIGAASERVGRIEDVVAAPIPELAEVESCVDD